MTNLRERMARRPDKAPWNEVPEGEVYFAFERERWEAEGGAFVCPERPGGAQARPDAERPGSKA